MDKNVISRYFNLLEYPIYFWKCQAIPKIILDFLFTKISELEHTIKSLCSRHLEMTAQTAGHGLRIELMPSSL